MSRKTNLERRKVFKVGVAAAAAAWVTNLLTPLKLWAQPPGERRGFPSEEKMRRSASYHVLPAYAKSGEEGAMLEELRQAAGAAREERGVRSVAIFQKVEGEGPSHLAVMIADNPGVAHRLSNNERVKGHLAKVGNRSQKKSRVTKDGLAHFNSALLGKLS